MVDDDLDDEEAIKVTGKKNLENDIEDEILEVDEIINIKESKNHPLDNVIGNLNQRTLRSQAQNQSNFFCFISTIEPKNVNEALKDEIWIIAMQEELNQFIANDVWELVPHPKSTRIIGTKWVYRNNLDKNGIVSRNKVRLVAQGYNQQGGIDYDETYAPVARLESIRILLAYSCALDFKLFQMDIKSAFPNGFINVEVYVAQPLGFIDFEKPNHVYKLKKALYGLKQASKVCDQYAYVLYDHDMYTLAPHYERKTRKDYGTKRGRPFISDSSSSAFDHPSSSHHVDDDDDENNKDSTGCVTPFVRWIEDYTLPDGLKMPSHVVSYDGKGDPDNYLHLFEGAISMKKLAMPVDCHMVMVMAWRRWCGSGGEVVTVVEVTMWCRGCGGGWWVWRGGVDDGRHEVVAGRLAGDRLEVGRIWGGEKIGARVL
ncbi:retrovirus-related pol polyprotein from transposon TNT 1-94 [Tanacetum coccineum]